MADVKPGDYVKLTAPMPDGQPVAEVWQLRRDHSSLVIAVTDSGHVACMEPEEKQDRRVHEWWTAKIEDVTVVRCASYYEPVTHETDEWAGSLNDATLQLAVDQARDDVRETADLALQARRRLDRLVNEQVRRDISATDAANDG